MNDDEKVTYFGETDARNKRVRFGIKKKDRSRHMYVIGKTAMGKSTLLENLAIQDIQNGEGLAFIDPHGKTADLLLEYVPEHRIKDVIYFAPFDLDFPISFNVLEDVGAERRHLVANGLMTAFKKIWVDAWSARMEYILTNIILALLEYPGSTLMGVNRMLVDKDFRKTIVDNISDPSVKAFWTEEYAKYTDKFAAEAAPAIQNKVGQFVANPLVRNIIGQSQSSFDIRKVMDERKILIINLSKGRVGEANANLLGAMIITKIYLAAMSRADLNEQQMKEAAQFYLYVDEFQSFANESFADILSEARKYKLCLIIAHQYIEQMTDEVRAAVFGNVGTMVTYRVGSYDAAVFEKEFTPQFTAEDMVNLQQYQMYLKLMIDQVTSTPFSAMGMTPIPKPERTFVNEIIASSRELYANPRDVVEDMIRNWHIDKLQPIGGEPSSGNTGGGQGYAPREGGKDRFDSRGGDRPSYDRPSDRGDRPERSFDRGDRPQSQYRPEQRSDQRSEQRFDRPPASQGSYQTSYQGSSQGSSQAPRPQFNGDRNDRRDARPQSDRPSFDRPAPDRDRQFSERPPQQSFNRPDRDKDRGDERDNRNREPQSHAAETRDAQNREIQNQEDSKAYARQREKELRDAISLNYLKDKKQEDVKQKNTEKGAKPQNILALKEALLGILGEATEQTTQPAETETSPQNQVSRPSQRAEQRSERTPMQSTHSVHTETRSQEINITPAKPSAPAYVPPPAPIPQPMQPAPVYVPPAPQYTPPPQPQIPTYQQPPAFQQSQPPVEQRPQQQHREQRPPQQPVPTEPKEVDSGTLAQLLKQ